MRTRTEVEHATGLHQRDAGTERVRDRVRETQTEGERESKPATDPAKPLPKLGNR